MMPTKPILAIDPGTAESGFCVWNSDGPNYLASCAIWPNHRILEAFSDCGNQFDVVIEMVACYGMPVGAEVFETACWIGRMNERLAWGTATRVPRKDVVMHFCHTHRAGDPQVRQVLIDRFGPKGTKKQPGILYGVKSHMWQAVGLAVFFADGGHLQRSAASAKLAAGTTSS